MYVIAFECCKQNNIHLLPEMRQDSYLVETRWHTCFHFCLFYETWHNMAFSQLSRQGKTNYAPVQNNAHPEFQAAHFPRCNNDAQFLKCYSFQTPVTSAGWVMKRKKIKQLLWFTMTAGTYLARQRRDAKNSSLSWKSECQRRLSNVVISTNRER